jgi:transcriptional regulator with PAS, ATPase and Fis domain
MNLTQLNQRLDQIQSEIIRRNGRVTQLLNEVGEIEASPVEIVPLETLERAAILNAVNRCRNKNAAAKALGIGKTSLYRKLEQYAREGAL